MSAIGWGNNCKQFKLSLKLGVACLNSNKELSDTIKGWDYAWTNGMVVTVECYGSAHDLPPAAPLPSPPPYAPFWGSLDVQLILKWQG